MISDKTWQDPWSKQEVTFQNGQIWEPENSSMRIHAIYIYIMGTLLVSKCSRHWLSEHRYNGLFAPEYVQFELQVTLILQENLVQRSDTI